MGTMRNPKTCSNVSSVSCPTSTAPITDPDATGTSTGRTLDHPEKPRRRKPAAAVAMEVRIPIRLEPLATLPGTPASTSRGTVSSDPPPAIVLTTPAARPPNSNRTTSNGSTAVSVSPVLRVQNWRYLRAAPTILPKTRREAGSPRRTRSSAALALRTDHYEHQSDAL